MDAFLFEDHCEWMERELKARAKGGAGTKAGAVRRKR